MSDTPSTPTGDESNSTFGSRRAERLGARDKTVQAGDAATKTDGGDGGPGAATSATDDASSSSEPTASADEAQDAGEDLNALTVPQLQERAGGAGVEGRSSMTKAELISAISTAQSA